MGRHVVAADAQNLSILLLKLRIETPERRRLVSSTAGKIQHVKRKHHAVSAAITAQRNIAMMRRGKREISGNIANLAGHLKLLKPAN